MFCLSLHFMYYNQSKQCGNKSQTHVCRACQVFRVFHVSQVAQFCVVSCISCISCVTQPNWSQRSVFSFPPLNSTCSTAAPCAMANSLTELARRLTAVQQDRVHCAKSNISERRCLRCFTISEITAPCSQLIVCYEGVFGNKCTL